MPLDNVPYGNKGPANSMELPLHRLEQEIAKDLRSDTQNKRPSDAASIYSFDSVSTSGRLLDRLDLENEDYDEDFLRRRESYALIQSTGRLLDRLGLDDDGEEALLPLLLHLSGLPVVGGGDPRFKPVRASSAISLTRMKSSAQRPPIRALSSHSSSNGRLPLQNVGSGPFKQPLERPGVSVDSFHADMNSHSSLSLRFNPVQKVQSASSLASETSLKMPGSFEPETENRLTGHESMESLSPTPLPKLPLPLHAPMKPAHGLRLTSHSSQTSNSSADVPIFNPNTKFNPELETMVKQASLLRNQNDREALYQLQLAGNAPNNYPKAMFLYAMALQYGLGVKKNDTSCVKWLCRCILVSQIVETDPVDTPSLNNYVQRLHELQPQALVRMVCKQTPDAMDPFDLYDDFLRMTSSTISKIISMNNKENNTLASAYHRLGEAVLLGSGLPAKDTISAIQLFSKAASLGYPVSMVKLGELWGTKSKNHKKDFHKSAAWLRLAELFGKKDIGNSWIYKSKYMVRPKK